ncbi:MAG: glycosyltransferase family 2 protein, partial [Bacteroidales bacterium]|nr:glycosyltransferase family 2 protein [Bacteroidales bacterium]
MSNNLNKLKNDSKYKPIISVITVVRNAEDCIEATIKSVVGQTYDRIQFIVIDGRSSDETLNIIHKYEGKIDKLVSEKDSGIYDAMNKGISLVSGDWVNFMNAGDEFFSSNTCELVAEQLNIQKYDVLYGDLLATNNAQDMHKKFKAQKLDNIKKGMIFSHQSVFVKKNLLLKYPFDLDYKICADYLQFLTLYSNNYSFFYLPIIISRTSIEGISYSNIETIIEKLKIIHLFHPWSFYQLQCLY